MADEAVDPKLLVMIVRNDAVLDELVTGMLDAGLTDVTVVDSRDMGSILRHDMPIFAGLAALLPQTSGGRTVLALITPAQVASLRTFIEEMRPADRPVSVLLPVDEVFGLGGGDA
ncbi:MAG: hypothetical protein ACYTGG_10715 [Planctomycetota bacterium]|jgi:hypothetical protein